MTKLWMVNDIGGSVDVFERYLIIRFSHSRDKTYRIEANLLLELLKNMRDEFVMGELTFILICLDDGAKTVGILNEKTKSDKDQAVVYLNELMEALYYWVG